MALEGVTWELPRPFGELPWGLRGDCKHVRVLSSGDKNDDGDIQAGSKIDQNRSH